MRLPSNRATALAALALSRSLLTACGSDDTGTGTDSGSDSGGGERALTMLPKNLGNPSFDTSTTKRAAGRIPCSPKSSANYGSTPGRRLFHRTTRSCAC